MLMPEIVKCSGCDDTVDIYGDGSDSWTTIRRGGKSIARFCGKCVPESLKSESSVVASHPVPELHPLQRQFGFNAPEDGSAYRYDGDLQSHGAWVTVQGAKAVVPWIQFRFWWWLHNCVAHLIIGVLPMWTTFKFHDWTSRKMHGK